MPIVERWPFRKIETRVNVVGGPPKKNGRCREVAVVERWLLEEVRLNFTLYFVFLKML